MTADGETWLKRALDPFHDYELGLTGYPDRDASKTVTQEVRYTYDLAKPPVTAAIPAGNWDAHIFFSPIQMVSNNAQSMSGLQRQTRQIFGFTGANYPAGATIDNIDVAQPAVSGSTAATVDIFDTFTVQSGAPNFRGIPNGSLPLSTLGSWLTTALGAPLAVKSGRRRLIAAGIEIHNTTAEIYKQGTLTAYTVPQKFERRQFMTHILNPLGNNASGAATPYINDPTNSPSEGQDVGPKEYFTCSMPPSSAAEAMAYSGTRQWEASKGAYVVARLHEDNPLRECESGYFAFIAGDKPNYPLTSSVAGTVGDYRDFLGHRTHSVLGSSAGTGSFYFAQEAARRFECLAADSCGIWLNGLSETSTFRLEIRLTFETAPNYADPQSTLTYMARRSPDYDPCALELYQRAAEQLPVAVPVSMNPAGEWFQMVYSAIKSALPTVIAGARAIAPLLLQSGVPQLEAAGMAASAIPDISNFKPNAKTLNRPRSSSRSGSAKRVTVQPSKKKKRSNSASSTGSRGRTKR